MKKLLIARHAKSGWSDSSLSDFERTLNKRGENDALLMANYLQKCGLIPELIIASAATRTMQTAKRFATVLKLAESRIIPDNRLYLASAEIIMEFIATITPNINVAMIVGHNPGITSVISHLAGVAIDNVPTCGIGVFGYDITAYREVFTKSPEVFELITPKKLRHI
jgi:phosphohistidine phosphatase